MAVTALVARDQRGTRSAARLGAVWGAGHATALLLIGLPLILLGTALPPALESTAETAVGVVIILLALRVLVRWVHRNREHDHDRPLRTPNEAFGIGLLHGLAGTGAVVLLLIAALPIRSRRQPRWRCSRRCRRSRWRSARRASRGPSRAPRSCPSTAPC